MFRGFLATLAVFSIVAAHPASSLAQGAPSVRAANVSAPRPPSLREGAAGGPRDSVLQGNVLVLPLRNAGLADSSARGSAVVAFFAGEKIPVFSDAAGVRYAIVPADMDMRPGSYPFTIAVNGSSRATTRVVVARKNFPISRFSGRTARRNAIKKSPALRARAQEERELKKTIFAERDSLRLWQSFSLPLDSIFVTAAFGQRRGTGIHRGTDLRVRFDSSGRHAPVRAAGDGIVRWPEPGRDLLYEGNMVLIDHGQGIISFALHLDSVSVKRGDRVHAGDIIGIGGSTGSATSPHLHFALHVGGACVDPIQFIQALKSVLP